MSTLKYWLWLATREGLSRATIYKAVDCLGSQKGCMKPTRKLMKRWDYVRRNDMR